ncbi:10-formyltetrahydrofolate:L-methionyl-tRNA(fMet) N-formyltransferase [uncultured Eubacteriales bacterium]|uniref:Methionyl-tRNA formyltransferase n=1 Tax=uncultured Eubacteriales bacterium TaxID=172733 RepID=A0A212JYV0_9FIRM|nr:10-formyltetrahydrofolate:L-methionyl-tRNA(fMet) N-formyltransferase [uncultured Eubacteriales bacterium]
MGTPEFAVPSLKALTDAGHELCGVFSQPDKPVGRHQNVLQPTPVKAFAMSKNIPVFQPTKLRDGTALALIRELEPELIVVAAYGRFLPDEILDYPAKGCINVHSSLLPKYRGAAPINWAVLNGDAETGVTIQHLASEMDTGDIIAQTRTSIGPDETAAQLYGRLAELGGALLVETVAEIEAGTATRSPQDGGAATLAPMLSKALSPMDWNRTAWELHNQVRGLLPWPCAVTELAGVRCKIFSTAVLEEKTSKPTGTILAADKNGIRVACGGGTVLRIDELQADGSKRMGAADYLRGHPIAI